jgi:hypothetical protein
MAHEVIEKHSSVEFLHEVDFTEDLPDDTSISSGSAVSAVDSDGDAASAVVGTVSQSGMKLRCVVQGGEDGEDYLYTFLGRGTTTSRDACRLVEVRVRDKQLGTL